MTQRFAWTGHTPQGSASGVLDAVHAGAAADTLVSRGITPLTIAPCDTADLAAQPWSAWFEPRVAPMDRLVFSRQLSTLLRAGVPILRALAGLQDTATSEKMRTTLAEVRRSLESGIALSMSLAQHPRVFDNFYLALVRVGEMTGRLDEVFLRLFHHQEHELFMRQQIRSALRYPAFVVGSMVAALVVINVMVIPAFATVFQNAGATLPLATRVLLATSRFTLEQGWLLVLTGLGGAALLHAWHATPQGRLRWDGWMLRLPVAGAIVRKAMLARFARSFALSLRSGVPLSQALTVVAQTVDNQHIARRIDAMRESVERGESLLRAAAVTGIFTPIVLQMLAVGEETGAVDELLEEVSELYRNEVGYELKSLGARLEPLLIVFLGVLVLLLALGVFLPVWELSRTAFAKSA